MIPPMATKYDFQSVGLLAIPLSSAGPTLVLHESQTVALLGR